MPSTAIILNLIVSKNEMYSPSDECSGNESSCTLRLSDTRLIEKTRKRTLKMTCLIVVSFFCCWTPYVVIHLWYLFDSKSAESLDTRIQSFLFMFAVFNSCINPLVYGSYIFDFKGSLKRLFQWPMTIFKSGNSSVNHQKEIDYDGPMIAENSSRTCGEPTVPPGEVYLELKQATPVRRPLNHGCPLKDDKNLKVRPHEGFKIFLHLK
ncbi:g_PROTEIN_RECEP_F1_2 domain-containing protein [Caerostris extrusa]|uniref:G_PROTEIN_RECEP_F1_2 domain-containing protein n=1 Tax=Caerostris extrusa TaxID=172846 RepID=A0AAV4SKA6_CAEEX|nr:g_PROTEIN_RECEP_F1_2 domain-containing protein [Caerostris extrusa]